MKQKILSLALALLVALPLCLALVAPAYAASSDFTIDRGVLTKYNGSGGVVTIPSSVTEIGFNAFEDCTSLTSVTIPNSVTEIGDRAFVHCTNLTSVTIPNSVTKIDNYAFAGCTSLTNVTIPYGVTKIGYMAFCDCANLTSVTIPDSVTEINAWAFRGCSRLTNVTMPVRLYLPTASFISTLFWLPGDDFRNIFDGPFIATPWGTFQAIIQVSVLAALTAILIISLKAWRKNKEQSDPEGYARKKQEKQKRKEAATVRSGMVTCSCGAVNPTSAAFCSKCGKPVVVPGRCECGHQNDPEAQFCQKCGKSLPGQVGRTEQPEASGPATVETAQTDSTLVKPTAPVNRTPLIVAIVAGVALLVLLALLILRPQLGPQPSPAPAPDLGQTSQSQQEPEQDPAAALVGTWTNEDGVGLRFTSDGTVTLSGFGINLGGDTFTYAVTGEDTLTLTAKGGIVSADMECPYGILDNTLYIELGGGTYTLTKK